MTEIVASYADLAMALMASHTSDSCGCLICADIRKAIGHRPLIDAPARRLP